MTRLAGVLLILIFLATAPAASSAVRYMDSVKAHVIVESQRCLFNNDFRAADSLTEQFTHTYPGDPAVWLLRAAVMMAEMYTAEDELYDSTYKAAIDSLQSQAAAVLDTAADSTTKAWMCLWRASAKAYKSLWEAKFGGMFAAVKLGFAARSECERGLDFDSTVADLYMGLGTFHYWKSAKAGVLRWMFILKNEKEKGVRELRRAMDDAVISRETAESGLIWIWLDMEEYDSTVTYAGRMAERYPQATSFLWPLGTALFEEKKYDSAAIVFEKLRTRLDPDPGNYFNWIACDWWLARCYESLKEDERAHAIGQRFAGYQAQIPPRTRDRQKDNTKYLRKWSGE